MYVPEGRSVAHREEPLLLLLHWGDMWTVSVRERQFMLTKFINKRDVLKLVVFII
ncbi:MAG: hypothetical protein ABII27_04775 [bacterium]